MCHYKSKKIGQSGRQVKILTTQNKFGSFAPKNSNLAALPLKIQI